MYVHVHTGVHKPAKWGKEYTSADLSNLIIVGDHATPAPRIMPGPSNLL